MSDLFDQLKSAGPVKKKHESPLKTSSQSSAGPVKKKQETPLKTSSKTSSNHDKKVEKFNATHKSKSVVGVEESRRASIPSSEKASVVKKSKSHKSRSLSPPKVGVDKVIKSLKVKLERKKLETFLTRPLDEHANNIRVKNDTKDKTQSIKTPTNKTPTNKTPTNKPSINKTPINKTPINKTPMEKTPTNKTPTSKIPIDKIPTEKAPINKTPTKAQQKLFEPMAQKKSKSQQLREFNIKPCKVRIHRDNLKKLLKDFKNKKNKQSKDPKPTKRPASSSLSGSPPSKKGKLSAPTKNKSNFFIKLNTSPSSKLEKKLKNLTRLSSSEAHHNKIRNSKTTTTTPTKFSRSHLIRSFGQRFFKVHVKIERCTHPLMLTFESNDRARRSQAKRHNKSKNLSVSFREQVEVFGDSSSDSDDSRDEDFCAIPKGNANRKAAASRNNTSLAPATPVVMPARLKKVENGRVVEDIELDPTLFIDPKILKATSTPFSPGRKKRDHKSFSPLKDEGTPSPRKEQLKLANEKIPPSGFRHLNIEEEDDEDDDCEFIVPFDMPQRRTSSNDGINSSQPLAESTNMLTDDIEEETNNITDDIDLTADTYNINNFIRSHQQNKSNEPKVIDSNQLETVSDDSFQSTDGIVKTSKNNAKSNVAKQKTDKLQTLQNSPTLELNDALDMAEEGAKKQKETDQCLRNNGNYDGDDFSMNLFMEDSQSNENDNHSKSFVDSLINETIDKLTKDIDESATDQQFTN